MNRIVISFFLVLQLTSCTFHSFQYDYLKSLTLKGNNTQKPEKNWTGIWLEKKIDLFAINLKDQVIFADENINIFFKEKQLYKVTGLIDATTILEVDMRDSTLVYIQNGKIISKDRCKSGQFNSINTPDDTYSRYCHQNQPERIYENKIFYNAEGMIIGLKYKIHPDYPSIELSMK